MTAHPSVTRLLAVLILCSCATSRTAPARPKGWAQAPVTSEPMRIIELESARERSIRSEPAEIGFGDHQNGTELVLAFLEEARQRHAAFVSDLWVAMMFKWRGQAVECRSRVRLEGERQTRPAGTQAAVAASDGDGTPIYSTDVQNFQPTSMSYRATDIELFCKKHGVIHIVPRQPNRLTGDFDASNSFNDGQTTGGNWGTETEIVYEDVCEKRPVTRDTTRYDYQEKLGFVPVNWPEIAKRFADGKLVEGPPACYHLEDSELAGAHHRVHGQLFYRAGTADVPMAPSTDIYEHYRTIGK